MTKRPRPKGGTHAERIRRERGALAQSKPSEEEDYLTPSDLLGALRNDVLAVSKAAELRIRELTVLVTEYAQGLITPQEANARFYQHADRWGDAIEGVRSVEGMTDDEILKAMEARRAAPHR